MNCNESFRANAPYVHPKVRVMVDAVYAESQKANILDESK